MLAFLFQPRRSVGFGSSTSTFISDSKNAIASSSVLLLFIERQEKKILKLRAQLEEAQDQYDKLIQEKKEADKNSCYHLLSFMSSCAKSLALCLNIVQKYDIIVT